MKIIFEWMFTVSIIMIIFAWALPKIAIIGLIAFVTSNEVLNKYEEKEDKNVEP